MFSHELSSVLDAVRKRKDSSTLKAIVPHLISRGMFLFATILLTVGGLSI